jgi:acetamidase/formamidase
MRRTWRSEQKRVAWLAMRPPGAASCTAAERNATVRLRLKVIKGKKVPWMRIDKPGSTVALYAARPLEAAVETATVHLIDWLVTEHGFSATDAYCLVSTCPDFRINVYQMCKIGSCASSPARNCRSGVGGA